jgi:hypothetical protein
MWSLNFQFIGFFEVKTDTSHYMQEVKLSDYIDSIKVQPITIHFSSNKWSIHKLSLHIQFELMFATYIVPSNVHIMYAKQRVWCIIIIIIWTMLKMQPTIIILYILYFVALCCFSTASLYNIMPVLLQKWELNIQDKIKKK